MAMSMPRVIATMRGANRMDGLGTNAAAGSRVSDPITTNLSERRAGEQPQHSRRRVVRAGNVEEGRQYLESCLALAETRYVQPSILAMVLASLGRMDDAFAMFDRSLRERDLLPVLNHFAAGHAVTQDPRFPALMRRIGLTPSERLNWRMPRVQESSPAPGGLPPAG